MICIGGDGPKTLTCFYWEVKCTKIFDRKQEERITLITTFYSKSWIDTKFLLNRSSSLTYVLRKLKNEKDS